MTKQIIIWLYTQRQPTTIRHEVVLFLLPSFTAPTKSYVHMTISHMTNENLPKLDHNCDIGLKSCLAPPQACLMQWIRKASRHWYPQEASEDTMDSTGSSKCGIIGRKRRYNIIDTIVTTIVVLQHYLQYQVQAKVWKWRRGPCSWSNVLPM